MVDAKGNKVSVGDKVHYFGWHNMKPTGVIESIEVNSSGQDIAVIRPINSKKPGDYRRTSDGIVLIPVKR